MTPPSPTADLVSDVVDVTDINPPDSYQPTTPARTCLNCYRFLGTSVYGVLCDECGEAWLYRREDERSEAFWEVCARDEKESVLSMMKDGGLDNGTTKTTT